MIDFSPNSTKSKLEIMIDYEIETFTKLLRSLNEQLDDQLYFGGQMSICDILYYTEISTITHLTAKQFIPNNTRLYEWYTKTMRCVEINELDGQLRKAITDYKDSQTDGQSTHYTDHKKSRRRKK